MSYENSWGYQAPVHIKRTHKPPISIYFMNDADKTPAYKLSCMFCKRTILDDVKGTIDKVVDTPQPAEDFNLAMNLQCKSCNQKYRILGHSISPRPN